MQVRIHDAIEAQRARDLQEIPVTGSLALTGESQSFQRDVTISILLRYLKQSTTVRATL